jgi:hypothetical protein
VRLRLDEHHADAIAQQLRAAGHDAESVSERKLKGIDDEPLLILTWDASLPRHKGTVGRYLTLLAALMTENQPERALGNQVRWLG